MPAQPRFQGDQRQPKKLAGDGPGLGPVGPEILRRMPTRHELAVARAVTPQVGLDTMTQQLKRPSQQLKKSSQQQKEQVQRIPPEVREAVRATLGYKWKVQREVGNAEYKRMMDPEVLGKLLNEIGIVVDPNALREKLAMFLPDISIYTINTGYSRNFYAAVRKKKGVDGRTRAKLINTPNIDKVGAKIDRTFELTEIAKREFPQEKELRRALEENYKRKERKVYGSN